MPGLGVKPGELKPDVEKDIYYYENEGRRVEFDSEVVDILKFMASRATSEVDEKAISSQWKEYGKYLAYAVANCRGCHTNRDMKTGEYIGEEYAGGLQFGPDNLTQGDAFITPNLTPDSKTGIMTNWNEEEFVTRMKGGRIHDFSPMPWGAFRQMEDDDLRAIYMFLMDLDPIQNDVGEVHTPAET